MSAKKMQLKERGTDVSIYPITSEECVLDENGNPITEKLTSIKNTSTEAYRTALTNHSEIVNIKTVAQNHFNNLYEGQQHIPEGGQPNQVLTWKSDGTAQWSDIRSTFTDLEDLLAYGVQWDIRSGDPQLERIGNETLHKTLPIQSQLKGCITQKGKVMYWLDENDWRFRKDPIYVEATIDSNEHPIVLKLDPEIEETFIGQYVRYTTDSGTFVYKIRNVVRTSSDPHSIVLCEPDSDTIGTRLEGSPSKKFTLELGSRLDGYDGTVQVYCPEFYIKSKIVDDNIRQVWLSTVKIDDTWTHQPEVLIDAYRSTVLRQVPSNMGYLSTLPVNSLVSVVNTETYCRGGGNRSAYDTYLSTDRFRTDLGKPATSLVRANARTFAKNAGNHLLSYDEYKNIFYWLYVVEYANFNCQKAFTSELTPEGYRLGGMGNGATTYTQWTLYNTASPVTPCGYCNEFGNGTGIKELTIPTFDCLYQGDATITQHGTTESSSNVTYDNTTNTVRVTKISGNFSYFLYAIYSTVPGRVTYKITNFPAGQSIDFKCNGTTFYRYTAVSSQEERSITVTWPNIPERRQLETTYVGTCDFTIQITSVEPSSIYFPSHTLSVPRWRGFDNPFGDINTCLDGIIIDATKKSDNMDYIYTCQDPDKFGETLTDDWEKIGETVHQDGWIRQFTLGTVAHIIPILNGGSSTIYHCDYHSAGIYAETVFRNLIMGGGLDRMSYAGIANFVSTQSITGANLYVGFRQVTPLQE